MSGTEGDREAFAAFLLRLRTQGLTDKALLSAFEATPRGEFLPGQWRDHAWSERMLPIECGEAIEGVDLQARVIAALEMGSGLRVLEIGTGSGYTAAVLSRLAGGVVTLERYRMLVDNARGRIGALGATNVSARQADGSGGLPAEGPFDRIVVWAAFEALPRGFVDQLATGGIMVAPVGPGDGRQTLVKLTKTGSRFEREELATVRLQPLAQGLAAVL